VRLSGAEVVQIAVPFVWLGVVLAISFLETPLKFRAPGITVPLGLGVGRLVFRALRTSPGRWPSCTGGCSPTTFSAQASPTSPGWTSRYTCR
jgi:hypothetical protein